VHDGGGDAHEDIVVHEVPLTDAADWLAARVAGGALVDPKVYAGLFFCEVETPGADKQ
jgi:ADP-ribose pyrophosphatase